MAISLNLGIFLTISRSNISQVLIFLKNRFHSNWRSHLVLTSGRKPKKSLKPFLRKIPVCFWANLETFSRIPPNQELFSKIRLCHFSTFIVPLLHAKNQKNHWSRFWENCVTNQPTNHYQQHRFYKTSLTPVQQIIRANRKKIKSASKEYFTGTRI